MKNILSFSVIGAAVLAILFAVADHEPKKLASLEDPKSQVTEETTSLEASHNQESATPSDGVEDRASESASTVAAP